MKAHYNPTNELIGEKQLRDDPWSDVYLDDHSYR